MKLYLVRGNEATGENQDLFVVAADPAGAIDVWNDYLITNGWPRDDNDEEETLPRVRTVDPDNVREILPDVTGTLYAGAARGIDWDTLNVVWEA